MKNVRTSVRAAALVVAFVFWFSPASSAAEKVRRYEATAVEYNINASPQMKSSTFKSRIEVVETGAIRVYTIENFVSAKREPDVKIKIAISSGSVGSRIMNAKSEVIAEYTKGTVVNENLYIFTQDSGGRKVVGRWFIGGGALMSDFSLTDDKGTLLYKETVVYSAR